MAWGDGPDLVLSGGGDGLLRWWDVQLGECIRTREAHAGTVQALRRSRDGSKVASCGDDGAIMLWDLRTGDHLQTLRRDRPYERLDITRRRWSERGPIQHPAGPGCHREKVIEVVLASTRKDWENVSKC